MAITKNIIRKPNVAGSFYEKDPHLLQKSIASFFAKKIRPDGEVKGKHIRALISPHAGYMYCGRVMASAYQLLIGKHYTKVILIGPSHSIGFSSVAFDTAHVWETPLGTTPIDTKTNERFLFHEEFDVLPQVFDKEHSLEVELPFLQTVLSSFSLIPLCTGQNILHTAVSEKLKTLLTDETLVVVSSDFSHYHPQKDANTLDHDSIQAILSKNPSRIDTTVDACGLEAIKILNDLSIINHWKPIFLDYKTSADVTGDMSAVVGYASFAYV
jgi:hypothetical protein